MARVKMNLVTVNEFEKATGVHIAVKHNGKMSGMWSMSTSCLENPYCKARMEQGGIWYVPSVMQKGS